MIFKVHAPDLSQPVPEIQAFECASWHRSADWHSAVSRIGNRLAIRPPAEYHSAKQQTASLRYKPASIRIGGSAKMRPAFECIRKALAQQDSAIASCP